MAITSTGGGIKKSPAPPEYLISPISFLCVFSDDPFLEIVCYREARVGGWEDYNSPHFPQ